MRKVLISAIAIFIILSIFAFLIFNPTAKLSSVLSNTMGIADFTKGVLTDNESDILTMMDSKEIKEADLDDMFFSEKELKSVLKSVEDSKELVSNTITYEYYYEKWCLIEEVDENGKDTSHWGWIKGYDHEDIVITNEDIEAEHKVYWQPMYVLASMASMYNGSFSNWKDDWDGKLIPAERIKKVDLENAIRVFNYEYYYLWDGARSQKTYYKWDELENISYRYVEEGDFNYQPPEGEEYIRKSKKIPATSIKNICNAPEQFAYQFIKNTQVTDVYLKHTPHAPELYEIDSRIWDVDIDLFTRACQLVAPNFEWDWFFQMLEMLPGSEESYELYKSYYEMYKKGAYTTETQYEIPQKKVILGKRLSELLDNPNLELADLLNWDGELEFPCPDYTRISSEYGYRLHPTLNQWRMHNGVDIAAKEGSDILSIADGVVVIATYSTTAGNYIVIDHGSGLQSVYMHASSLNVNVGEVVNKGSVIAYVGSTGRSTGPHLHLGVKLDGNYVDPMSYFRKDG